MDQETTQNPPGWNYNPSSFTERFPIISLALTGFGTAIYLGLYQLGILPHVWEPFFGSGSEVILHDTPLPRAGALLGGFFYLVALVLSLTGGRERWRTWPRIVLAQAVVCVGLGIAAVVLTIVHPVLYGHYCTLCLFSASCSVLLVGFALAEALATLQHRSRARQHGGSTHQALPGASGHNAMGAPGAHAV